MTPAGGARRASGVTVQALFRRSARIFADRIAVVDGAGGRHTYRAVEERARKLAGALRAQGLRRGDRIAVLAEPRLELVETFIARRVLRNHAHRAQHAPSSARACGAGVAACAVVSADAG